MTKKNDSPPFSMESEEGVLGSILIDNKWMGLVYDILSPSTFYAREHQFIYEAIEWLYNDKKPIDILTVSTYLSDRSLLEQAWWNSKLISLTDSVFTSSNVQQYAKTVRNKHLLRNVIQAGNAIQMMGKDEEKTIDDIFADIGDTVKKLSSLHSFSSMKDMDDDLEAYVLYQAEREGKDTFWYSWWPNLKWLDDVTGGIQKQNTHRIGAKSNTGKSQFVYQVIVNLLKQGVNVMFFTLEGRREKVYNYMLAYMQQCNSHALLKGDVKPDIDLMYKFRKQFTIVENTTHLSDIFAKTMKVKPDVVFLDYIGLVNIRGCKGLEMFDEYAKQVPLFAKEANVAWVDISNQKMSDTAELMKTEGQFHGSGALKQNLDIGIHITYHEPFYKFRESRNDIMDTNSPIHSISVLDVVVTKNRDGNKFVEKTYMLEFNKGGKYREATESELNAWKSSF